MYKNRNSRRCLYVSLLSDLILAIMLNVATVYPQTFVDSLMWKVVIFKPPNHGRMMNFPDDVEHPQATGFCLRTEDSSELYYVTAKHIIPSLENILKVGVDVEGIDKNRRQYTQNIYIKSGFKNSGIKIFHPDSLIDLLVLNIADIGSRVGSGVFQRPDGFGVDDIIRKDEFESIRKGQGVFYIGMDPDSINSLRNWYWIVLGVVDTIFNVPSMYEDKQAGFAFSGDFLLRVAIGKHGVSGSPVFVKVGDKYKVLGIVNAMVSAKDEIMCGTAGYRILEILGKN